MTRKTFSLLFAVCLMTAAAVAADGADSRYDHRFARLSYLAGRVSFQHTGDVDWSAASINMSLQPADRVYTGDDGRAEIEFDEGSVLRIAEKTDVEILALGEDRIQVRLLVGLATLTAASGVDFEISTPAASCTTVRKGVYRFDVRDNGDTDAIVRKGVLEAVNKQGSRRVETGDLVHVTAGDGAVATVSRYNTRDAWDEWNDRRNADRVAYNSRKYIPAYVGIGVHDLDRYGRWVTIDEYGPAWVPSYVRVGWSPYWEGRWWYRPSWGWTWTSYEPWGWLPYHYGRWHWSLGVGWAWLPGPSFGFHFWSPGLVRFYRGPSWVSWCPLGPGDYYSVNHYYYRPAYRYYLADLRMTYRRSPSELANRDVPGAFRTASTEQFTDGSFGTGRRVSNVADAERPWERGRLVSERLSVEPTSRSYSPMPDQARSRPAVTDRPVLVRGEPAVPTGSTTRFVRLTDRLDSSAGTSERPEASTIFGRGRSVGAIPAAGDSRGGEPGRSSEPAYVPRIWDRRALGSEPAETRGGRSSTLPTGERGSGGYILRGGGDAPGRSGSTGEPARRYERGAPDGVVSPGRGAPQERTAPPERRPPDRDRTPPEGGSDVGASTYVPRTYIPRSDAPGHSSRPSYSSAPSYSTRPAERYERSAPAPRAYPSQRSWGGSSRTGPAYAGSPSRGMQSAPSGRSPSGPSFGGGSSSGGMGAPRSAPAPSPGGGGVLRRRDN